MITNVRLRRTNSSRKANEYDDFRLRQGRYPMKYINDEVPPLREDFTKTNMVHPSICYRNEETR